MWLARPHPLAPPSHAHTHRPAPAFPAASLLDCDVLVSERRESSRKPDEMYKLVERMCMGARMGA